jgi:hypothetical protein
MAAYMNRNPSQPGASTWNTPSGRPVQFYEARYATPGPQEWIYAPDAGPWYVTLYFLVSGGGAAFLEGTDEGISDITGTPLSPPTPELAPVLAVTHTYNLTDTVIDTVRIKVEGATAVRVNVVGGTVDVTARC